MQSDDQQPITTEFKVTALLYSHSPEEIPFQVSDYFCSENHLCVVTAIMNSMLHAAS
jgi:hypothetical protein